VIALFKALGCNKTFTKFNLRKVKLDRDSAIAAAEVFATNTDIRLFFMYDCAPNATLLIAPLVNAMSSNVNMALSSLNLVQNALDDKDIVLVCVLCCCFCFWPMITTNHCVLAGHWTCGNATCTC
jgi:hypothetical protein